MTPSRPGSVKECSHSHGQLLVGLGEEVELLDCNGLPVGLYLYMGYLLSAPTQMQCLYHFNKEGVWETP